jgi:predicted transcriptional regulator
MGRQPLGEQELAVLRFITDQAPISAREVSDHFAARRGLARTTVLTVMERLRKKGYFTREWVEGVCRYSPACRRRTCSRVWCVTSLRRRSGGAVSPLVAYLAHGRRLTDAEISELQKIVDELQTDRRRESKP